MPDIEPNLQTEQMERICYGMVSYSYLGSIMDTACSCPNTDGLIRFPVRRSDWGKGQALGSKGARAQQEGLRVSRSQFQHTAVKRPAALPPVPRWPAIRISIEKMRPP